jgi:hypothetical protein
MCYDHTSYAHMLLAAVQHQQKLILSTITFDAAVCSHLKQNESSVPLPLCTQLPLLKIFPRTALSGLRSMSFLSSEARSGVNSYLKNCSMLSVRSVIIIGWSNRFEQFMFTTWSATTPLCRLTSTLIVTFFLQLTFWKKDIHPTVFELLLLQFQRHHN